MRIMGLQKSSENIAWILTTFIDFAITLFLSELILFSGGALKTTGRALLLIFLLLFAGCVISFWWVFCFPLKIMQNIQVFNRKNLACYMACAQLHGVIVLLISKHWICFDCDTVFNDVHALHLDHIIERYFEHVLESCGCKLILDFLQ